MFVHGNLPNFTNTDCVYSNENPEQTLPLVSPSNYEEECRLADAEKEIRDLARTRTFSTRVSGQEVGFTNNDPHDLVVGIIDGKLRYELSKNDLRPAAASNLTQAAVGGTLLALTAVSYGINGQGLVTKSLISATHAMAIPKISKVPYLPPLMLPLLFSACIISLNYYENSVYTEFLTITVVSLFALMMKRFGKGLASGGWMSAKHLVLPVNMALSGKKEPHELKSFDVIPNDHSLISEKPLKLIISDYDGDLFWHINIGDSSTERIKMASKLGEDDDEDEEDMAPKKKGVKQKSSSLQTVKETGVIALSTLATITSNYFLGQGITTGAFNSIAGASCKAKMRNLPAVNAYGSLAVGAGLFFTARLLVPETTIGNVTLETLTIMCLTIMVSMATKGIKDRFISPKAPKCEQIYSLGPLASTFKILPNRPYRFAPPLSGVLQNNTTKKIKSELDINSKKIKLKLSVKEGKLTAVYSGIKEAERVSLGLARVKVKKPGPWAMVSFLGSSVALTLFASWATRQIQLSSVKDDLRINTAKLGEGVLSNICNSVFVTFMKQAGKNIPCLIRDGGMLPLTISAVALERYLLDKGEAPFLFAFVATSAYIGMIQKMAKMYVNGKQFGPKNWLLPKSFCDYVQHHLPEALETQKQERLLEV